MAPYVEFSLLSHDAVCFPDCGVPTVTHVHGLEVAPEFDGSPLDSLSLGESATYLYPNSQPAGSLLYHDHAAGLTRLNNWAGLVAAYIISDDASSDLGLLPACDVPIIINDRFINSENGSLGYPFSGATIGEPTMWASAP